MINLKKKLDRLIMKVTVCQTLWIKNPMDAFNFICSHLYRTVHTVETISTLIHSRKHIHKKQEIKTQNTSISLWVCAYMFIIVCLSVCSHVVVVAIRLLWDWEWSPADARL